MSSSLRKRRIARNHKRMKQQPKLNLVALMDIFTILVLFLMVNNGDVEVLQSDKNVTLPVSVSEQKPELELIIKISDADIIVQGRSVGTVEDALAQEGNSLEALAQELRRQASRAPQLTEMELEQGRSVVIMGDHKMPYSLLKRIMTTCAETDYRDISMAVNSRPLSPEAIAELVGEATNS
jgi:biopolymer transport protein ExbD